MLSFVAGYLGGQRAMARAARAAASHSASALRSDPVDELADRVERLGLLVEAMCDLLAERGLTEDDLTAALERAIERRESVPRRCPGCGSAVTGSLCQICGAEIDGDQAELDRV